MSNNNIATLGEKHNSKCFTLIQLNKFSPQPYEVDTFIIPIFPMRKSRQRGDKYLVQHHPVVEQGFMPWWYSAWGYVLTSALQCVSLSFVTRKKPRVLSMLASWHCPRVTTPHNSKGVIPINAPHQPLEFYDSVFETYIFYAPSSWNDLKFPNISYGSQPHFLYTGTCLHLQGHLESSSFEFPLIWPSLQFLLRPSGPRHGLCVPKRVWSLSITELPTSLEWSSSPFCLSQVYNCV